MTTAEPYRIDGVAPPETRARVEQVIARGHPRTPLRLGRTGRHRTSPRRPVTEVLTEHAPWR